MTLEQKAGQLIAVGFIGPAFSPELQQLIADLHIGGIFLFGSNVESPQQVAQLVRDAQTAARAGGNPPLFVAMDQEGGATSHLQQAEGFIEFPSAMAIAATGNLSDATTVGSIMARELKAIGVNMNLAPVLDVNINPANPIIGTRSFSTRPAQAAEVSRAMIEAMQAEGMLAVGKHFPGHGSTSEDSHITLPTAARTRAELDAVELPPFREAVTADIAAIMSSHIHFTALDAERVPATLSRNVLTGLLRDELNFGGVLMTDALEMGALADNGYPLPEAAVRALNAGADVLSMNTPFDQVRAAHARVVQAVSSGEIPLTRLDEAVRRVLRAKEKFGLFEAALPEPGLAASLIGNAEDRAQVNDIIARSVTLTRDDATLVPPPPGAPLFVVETPYAYGLSGSLGRPGMRVSENPTQAEIASAVAQAQGRAALVTTSDIFLHPAQADLVRALVAANVPVIAWAVKGPFDVLALRDVSPLTLIATYGTPPYLLIQPMQALLAGQMRAQGALPLDAP
jgi:beta-N-acetylhexosaminidase